MIYKLGLCIFSIRRTGYILRKKLFGKETCKPHGASATNGAMLSVTFLMTRSLWRWRQGPLQQYFLNCKAVTTPLPFDISITEMWLARNESHCLITCISDISLQYTRHLSMEPPSRKHLKMISPSIVNTSCPIEQNMMNRPMWWTMEHFNLSDLSIRYEW